MIEMNNTHDMTPKTEKNKINIKICDNIYELKHGRKDLTKYIKLQDKMCSCEDALQIFKLWDKVIVLFLGVGAKKHINSLNLDMQSYIEFIKLLIDTAFNGYRKERWDKWMDLTDKIKELRKRVQEEDN